MDKEDKPMSLIDHLEEFRTHLIRCLIAVALPVPLTYWLSQPAIEWLKRESCPENIQLHYFQPLELFFVRCKVALMLALLAAFPYVAYQVWHFVSPALMRNERRFALNFIFWSTFFFALGAALAIFLVLPAVFKFSLGMATPDIVPTLSVQGFVSMALMLALAFGIMFELPIVVVLLASLGIVSTERMSKMRPYIIVGIFIAAAVLTPGDIVLTQLALAIPAILLFEISLIVARFGERRAAKAAEQDIGA
ncbi:MAG: twin arginine-targeting protein translocase TatC [Lentisphaerae bacterium GWF2_52_8]|nr:MAG: twin arginine-targeting protein translocase TatC [Lentisphaerae bacterium GWF2_52_8]